MSKKESHDSTLDIPKDAEAQEPTPKPTPAKKKHKGTLGRTILSGALSGITIVAVAAAIVVYFAYFSPQADAASPELPFAAPVAPAVVKNVTVSVLGTDTLYIAWDKALNATGYEVTVTPTNDVAFNGTTKFPPTNPFVTAADSITVKNLIADESYTITVIAFNEKNGQKAYSTSPSTLILAKTAAPVLTSPLLTTLSMTTLFTSGVDGATGYEFSSSTTPDGSFVPVLTTEKPTSYVAEDTDNKVTFYKVRATQTLDRKTFTGEASQLAVVVGKTTLSAEAESYSAVVLAWEEIVGVSGYEIYVSEGEEGEESDFTLLATVVAGSPAKEAAEDEEADEGTALSYRHEELAEQTTYNYVIFGVLDFNGTQIRGIASDSTSTTTPQKPKSTYTPSTGGSSGGTSGAVSLAAQKDAEARVIAQQIANSIPTGGTDLARVSAAARIVSSYCARAEYMTTGPNYSTPYGVFIAGEYSCAGATRALGMVLSYMGFSWEHVNPNAWTHQWVRLTMDGQVGYADGQVGWAGYGKHPVE
jgi:hypothetical protein